MSGVNLPIRLRAPTDLCRVAKAKWRELSAPGAWGSGAVAIYGDALAEYCRLYARKGKADAMIAEHGEIVASPNGFPVQSPWVAIANKCRADMLKIMKEFGPDRQASAPVGKKEQRQVAAEKAAGKFAPRSRPKLAVSND